MAELLPNIRQRFFDANGAPLAGGKLYSYAAGTTTPLATYTDRAGTTPNSNPVILDARGEADIWITSATAYKFVLTDVNDVLQWSKDNVVGVSPLFNAGTGNVSGPNASLDSEVVLYSGTTGAIVKRATGTGFAKLTNGVLSTSTTVNLASEVTGTLAINKGGTGQTTASAALSALLPSQSGASGKVLTSDGTAPVWSTPAPDYVQSLGNIGNVPNAAGASVAAGVFTLQPADGTYGGILSALAQSIKGIKTFIDQLIRSSASSVTAFAGGGQASATQLSKDINRVSTVATAGDSVKLPAAVAGAEIVVINDGAASLNVFPATGETIDALGVNTAFAVSTSLKNVRFICGSNGAWKSAAGGSVSPLTAKGDLYTRGTSLDARLAVGSDGQALVADSAQPNGIKWAAVGDTVGPASSVDSEIALFSGTTGKLLQRAAGTGFVKAVSGVISYVAGISLTTDVSGTLPISSGGTGQTSQTAALNALLPAQTSNGGKVLKTDGTNASWVDQIYTQTTQGLISNASVAISTTDRFQILVVNGSTNAISASTTPFGTTAPLDKTVVTLIGGDDTKTVTLQYTDSAKGAVGNFDLIILTKYASATFQYLAELDRWLLIGRS